MHSGLQGEKREDWVAHRSHFPLKSSATAISAATGSCLTPTPTEQLDRGGPSVGHLPRLATESGKRRLVRFLSSPQSAEIGKALNSSVDINQIET